nr:MAG: putative RNA-binding protein, TRAM domain family [Candidatus Nanosalinarum sp. J07AB56]
MPEEDNFDDQFDEPEETETPDEETTDTENTGGDDSEPEFDKPVSEGETVEVEVEDLGEKGDGIARVDGFVVFVPGGEVGESYDVEVTSVGRKFAFAEIQE